MSGLRLRILVALLLAAAWICQAQPIATTIENESLRVHYILPGGYLSLISKDSRKPFLTSGNLRPEAGVATVTNVADPAFGIGRALEIAYENGESDRVMLFPKLPFALVRSRLYNPGAEPVFRSSVPALSARIDLGKPASELRTFGTGGLLDPADNPGSYAWLAVVEPASRRGAVLGWLTHQRGSGVIFSKVENDVPAAPSPEPAGDTNSADPEAAAQPAADPAETGREAAPSRGQVVIDAVIEYGSLFVHSGMSEDLETLAVGYFDDTRLGLEAWADAVAKFHKVRLKPQPAGYCTWYSRPHGGASDQEHLAELATCSATNLAPFGFSVVQIDDGWQSGFKRSQPSSPKKDFRSHNPKGPYPAGMKAAADRIKSVGLVPGIWLMPFAGTIGDPFFDAHPDWFVKDLEGKIYDTPWGGASLDMTHSGAREHLRSVVSRICGEWGYQYLKIDGLWTGTATRQLYVHSGYKPDDLGDVVFHSPDKTPIETFRSGLKLVRAAAGDKVFILGCNAPQNMRSYGASFGLVDAMRVGPDNGAEWKSLRRGPTFGTRHYFLHGRVWYNDPDPVYVRESMPINHARLICSWVALSGQLSLNSDWIPGLPAERLDILKRTLTPHQGAARPVDLFERDLPRIWTVSSGERTIVGLYNWDNKQADFDLPLRELGLNPKLRYQGFDFWADKFLAPVRGRIQVTVPGESCAILALRADAAHPQILSTSRHVTQGITDLREERWTENAKTLSGRSLLVAGDPYELRISRGARKEVEVRLDAQDLAAGVTAEWMPDGDFTRVRLESPATRQVSWKVSFR